ncbi:MAG: ATP-binding cassette domain-containing protein [Bacilli bacterium]|nr:ATP-binding cassette domain-containing protein [Bacilli bacterium]
MIVLKGISKYINQKKTQKYLLKDINLVFPEKGLVLINGETKSGKTVLVNIIGAMDKPSAGEMIIHGKKLDKLRDFDDYRVQAIGYVLQKYYYFKGTVKDNLKKVASITHHHTGDDSYQKLLAKLDFKGSLNDQVLYLSAGEMMKVNLASALLKDPEILIADDITSGLSISEENEIFALLKMLSKERLVLITSNKEVSYEVDRIITIENGAVLNDTSSVWESKTNNNYSRIKPKLKLKFKDIFQESLTNIRNAAFLTVLFIFFTSAFLIFYFTSDVLTEFDGPELILEVMEEHEVDYGNIYKVEVDYYVKKLDFSKADVLKIQAENPNFAYHKVLNVDLETFFPDAVGIVELPNENSEYNFLYGNFPKENNEYFATVNFANSLLRWAKLLGNDVNTIADLIGYTIPELGGLKLVGITDAKLWDNHAYVQAGFLDSIYLNLQANNQGYCNYLHVKISDNYADNYQLFSNYYGDFNFYIDPSKDYLITNNASVTVFPSVAVYYTMAEQDYSLSKVLLIFPFLFIFFLTPLAFKRNRRATWMKRMVGNRNSDILSSYLLSFLLIFLIILPLSILIGILRIESLEKIFSYQMRRTFYDIKFLNILHLCLYAFVFTSLGMIYPILKIHRSFPFDILNLPKNKQKSGEFYYDVRFND